MHDPTDPINDPIDASAATPDEPDVQQAEQPRVEEFHISGDSLVAKFKELMHEGNIRRIIIKHQDGQVLLEIPLTLGVVGGVIGVTMFPVIAALGAIGALVAHLTIVIERQV